MKARNAWDAAARLLAEGLAELFPDQEASVRAALAERLLAYARLLERWNRVYSLTAITAPEAVVVEHFCDALAVWPFVQGARAILDVGSGAGLPAIPIALAAEVFQEATLQWVHACEAVQKKAAFLEQCRIELGLRRFVVLPKRVEEITFVEGYDLIAARAFGSLAHLVEVSRHLLAPAGCWLALKGCLSEVRAELAGLSADWGAEVHRLRVPFLAKERTLVVLQPRSGTIRAPGV